VISRKIQRGWEPGSPSAGFANATLYFVGMAMPGQFMVAHTTKRGCPAQGRA
jgi:hypothetical protein